MEQESFQQNSDKDQMSQEELLSDLISDPVVFNQSILPKMFDVKVPDFHREIYKPISDPKIKLVVIKVPRGFGKTTLLQGYVIQQVVHVLHAVIVYISDTFTQAELHCESIREELEVNDTIINLYGKQQGRKWTSSQWTTLNGSTVIPKGSNQSIRGIKVGKDRPSLVIIDDPENDENSETQEQRDKLWRHLFAVIKPMLKGGGKGTKIVYLGTLINEDCVLGRLIDLLKTPPFDESPDVAVVELSARDDQGESIWPELWTTQALKDEERLYAEAGLLDVFYREYMGDVIARHDARFKPSDVAYYVEHDLPDDLQTYASIDLKFSQSSLSDFCAVDIFSVSPSAKAIFLREAIRKRMEPQNFLNLLTKLYWTYKPYSFQVQNVVLDEFFKYYAEAVGSVLPFEKIKISRSKNAKQIRIASLQPMYIAGILRFQRRHSDILRELWSHPRPKYDDLSDILASGVKNIYIPWYSPDIQEEDVFGSLKHIRNKCAARRNKKAFGLANTPPVLNNWRS